MPTHRPTDVLRSRLKTRTLLLVAITAIVALAAGIHIGRRATHPKVEITAHAAATAATSRPPTSPSSEDLAAALARLRDAPLSHRQIEEARTLFASWANRDPRAAANEAASLQPDLLRTEMLTVVASVWAAHDPTAAKSWGQTLISPADQGAVVFATLETWAKSEPARAATEALAIEPRHWRHSTVGAVLQQWAKKDLAAALQWSEQLSDLPLRDSAVLSIAYVWGGLDPKAALPYIERLPAARVAGFLNEILRSWAKRDAERALDHALKLPNDPGRDINVGNVFDELARKDIQRAFARLPELPAPIRQQYARVLIGSLARKDPDAALNHIRGIASAHERNEVLHGVVHSLSGDDPKLAAAYTLAMSPGRLLNEAVQAVSYSYAVKNPNGAREWLEAMPDGEARRLATPSIVASLSDIDARAAVTLAEGLPAGATRDVAMAIAADGWFRHDAAAALRWLDQWPEDAARVEAARRIALRWAQTDPAAAARFAQAQRPGSAPSEVFSTIAMFWAGRDLSAAWQWARHLPAGPRGSAAATLVHATVAQQGPAETARLVGQLPADAQAEAVQQLAVRWTEREPAAAAAWAWSLGEHSPAALVGVISKWSAIDASAASHWLAAQSPSTARERAAEAMISQSINGSPEVAARWVASVADPARRSQAMVDVARSWIRVNRPAAEAWMTQLGFTPQQLLQVKPGG